MVNMPHCICPPGCWRPPPTAFFSLRSFLLVLSIEERFSKETGHQVGGYEVLALSPFCPSGLSLYSTLAGVTPCSRVCNRQSGIYQSKRTATVVYIAPVDFPGCIKVIFQLLQPQTPTSVSSCPIRDASSGPPCRTRGTGQAAAPPAHLLASSLRTVNMCSPTALSAVTSVIPVNCILGMFWNRWVWPPLRPGQRPFRLPDQVGGLCPCLRARLGGAGEPPAWPLLTPL